MSINVKVNTKKTPGKTIMESILKVRGITDCENFFNPERQPFSSPYIFADMERAVKIIQNAISAKDKILIWGDFDADGVTSTAILCKTLDSLGANYSYFLPDRQNLGHGLNSDELLIQKSKNNIKVLITVDCGISNAKEIKLIKSVGVKTIVTDHHEPPEILPEADCILNPLAANSLKSTLSAAEIKKVSYMSGAGVALKLSEALLGDSYEDTKKQLLVLSAIGTISDVVPLVGENRTIAARGLAEINNGVHKGISRLFQLQKLNRKVKSDDVAFILAPRINAAGRLENPDVSIKLLLEDNPLIIDMTIEKLDSLNKVRQSLCENTYERALSMLKNPADCIVLFNEDWHLGIIGIVASRLVERFNLPVFLISKDEKSIFRCSIRGTPCCDIAKILKSIQDCFLGFGGHAFAGGFSADPDTVGIDTLTKRITEAVCNFKDETKVLNVVEVDMELNGADVTRELIEEIDRMEPFGAQNKRPSFLFKGAKLLSQKQIGKESSHLAFSVIKDKKEFSCIFWKRKSIGIAGGEPVDFIFRPELSVYNDEISIRLITDCILNDKMADDFSNCVKIFDHRQKTGILQKIDEYVSQKNGEVKVWVTTVGTKSLIEKYPGIKNNILADFTCKEKILMLFDFPPCIDLFRKLIDGARPKAIHIMNAVFSKNPDDYITLVCGMLKFAANQKGGYIDLKLMAEGTGLDEPCILSILDLLENMGCIRINSADKAEFIMPPSLELIHAQAAYEIYMAEFKRVNDFKEYLQTADLNSLRELCSC